MVKNPIQKTTVNRIRTLSRQDKSANQIQRILQREGRGIQRKKLLAYVRKFKGVKPKPQRYKYIPRKFRRRVVAKPKPKPKRIPKPPKEKRIAIFGKHKGKSKRTEAFGTGKNVYRFLIDAVKHPPKKRIIRINVDKVKGLSQRAKYIDYSEEWDVRPTVKS